MNTRFLPLTGVRITVPQLITAIFRNTDEGKEQFIPFLRNRLGVKNCWLVNSGTTALYLILKVLSHLYPEKKDVILPAYTAPALTLPIKKAGLSPRLVDISISDFNLNLDQTYSMVTKNTVAVLAVHMFGIPAQIQPVRSRIEKLQVSLIEDCCQSFGSQIKYNGGFQPVGRIGDFAFYSFGRGKNFPLFNGGLIITNNEIYAPEMEKEYRQLVQPGLKLEVAVWIKMVLFSLIINPELYGRLFFLVKRFKTDYVPTDFTVQKFTQIQTRIAGQLQKNIDAISDRRYKNGIEIIHKLNRLSPTILTPQINDNIRPAFYRIPIVLPSHDLVDKLKSKLWSAGIESSELYNKPIHHIFDLGYKKNSFPQSELLASNLLTLPCHPLVTQNDIQTIVSVIKGIV